MAERSDVDPYFLTPAGWPRPRVDGWPIPWVAPAHNLSEVNEGRQLASVGGAVCQVCGEGWEWGGHAYGFVWAGDGSAAGRPVPGDFLSEVVASPSTPVFFLDGALMHDRCAKLTATMCPHIVGRNDLLCVRVPANDANPVYDEKDRLRPTYPAGDCEVVEWPTPRRTA